MQSVYDHLKQSGKEAELGQEETFIQWGVSVDEPVIRLHNQPVQSIGLYVADGRSCGVTGNILRFHFTLKLPRDFTRDEEESLRAGTRLVRENRVMGVFGGKATGVKWTGGALAEVLNQDEELSRRLLGCAESSGETDFTIETINPDEVHIWGPRFSEPLRLSARFKEMVDHQEHACIFCPDTVDRIAGHILKLIERK